MSKVFVVDFEHQADHKVFIVDFEHQADHTVFVVDFEHQADHKVFIVDFEHQADHKVFIVDFEHQADGHGSVSQDTSSTVRGSGGGGLVSSISSTPPENLRSGEKSQWRKAHHELRLAEDKLFGARESRTSINYNPREGGKRAKRTLKLLDARNSARNKLAALEVKARNRTSRP